MHAALVNRSLSQVTSSLREFDHLAATTLALTDALKRTTLALRTAAMKLDIWSKSGVCDKPPFKPCQQGGSNECGLHPSGPAKCRLELKAVYPSYCTGVGQTKGLKECKSNQDCCVASGTKGECTGGSKDDQNECILPSLCQELTQARDQLTALSKNTPPALQPLPTPKLEPPSPQLIFEWTNDLEDMGREVFEALSLSPVLTRARQGVVKGLVSQTYAVLRLLSNLDTKLSQKPRRSLIGR